MTDAAAREPWTYQRKTAAELEQLAWDIVGGRVWGTWSAPDAHMSFLMLSLLDSEQAGEMQRLEIVHLFEYLDRASERSVNGMPMFLSWHMLDRTDAGALNARVQAVGALREQRQAEATSA